MEGVMMRNGDVYGLAIRKANGEICAQRLPWKSCFHYSWLKIPFLRGFPILVETLINGIHAMNRSAALANGETFKANALGAIFSLCIALVMAFCLFVIAPHLLSLFMLGLHAGGDVDGLSFHIWDGFYKTAIFVAYIWLISRIPDIRRVFQYHGAEHKTIHAWESGDTVNADMAIAMSRLHPRCGTTFLLIVVALSIVLHAILVPPFLKALGSQDMLARHMASIAFKLVLVIPISAAAYEIIRFTAHMPSGIAATVLQAPGLYLQRFTTLEPDRKQIAVALAALSEALDYEDAARIKTEPYCRAQTGVSMCEMI